MPSESVREHVNALPDGQTKQELVVLLAAVVDAVQLIATKLDADAGVTDTNYAALVAALVRD